MNLDRGGEVGLLFSFTEDVMEADAAIARRIKILRVTAGMSQRAFGALFGRSQGWASSIERGKLKLGPVHAARLLITLRARKGGNDSETQE